MDKVDLLPVDALIRTGDVDHAEWNYRPLLGWIQRLRFDCVVGLLGDHKFHRLLEVGYGSGVFMPTLRKCCQELCGVDIHGMATEIGEVLRQHGVDADLRTGGISRIPFPDGYFDCIVSVSALEFVGDLEQGCMEMRRVLSPDGVLVVVTPGHSRLLDLGLWVLTGERAEVDYLGRREQVIPTLLRYFRMDEQGTCRRPLGIFAQVYRGLRLKSKDREA